MIRPDAAPSDGATAADLDTSRAGPATSDPIERARLAAQQASVEGLAVFDEDLGLVYANPAFCSLYACDDVRQLRMILEETEDGWTRLFDPEVAHRVKDDILPVVARSGSWRGRLPAERSDGSQFTAELAFTRVADVGFVIAMHDVTESARAEAALRERQQMYTLLAHNSTDVISLHARDGKILYISPASLRLMGCESRSLYGKVPWDSFHPEDVEHVKSAVAEAFDGGTASVSYRLKVKSGAWIWFETLVRPATLDEDEIVTQVQCSTRDITARKELEEQLEHQALHDPLTGLPNRSLFMDRLSQAPLRARRSGTAYGVVYIDLNQFKQINDTLGHSVGDALLAVVADRLTAQMRESDTLARLSGDEFAIILENIEDPSIVEILAPRLLAIFDEPFDLVGTSLTIRPSIGVAIDATGEVAPEALLRSADLAMYAAKRDPEREWMARTDGGNGAARALQMALRTALEKNALELHYQPVVSVADGRPVALEALLRWTDEQAGSISPPEILAIAQQGNFGEELTRWVIRTALADSRMWTRDGFEHLRLCLNLSEDELTNPAITEIISSAVAEAGTMESALQLELRERSLQRHADKLAALRAAGAIIAIDGFGIDPVSLPLLARAPIDALKIARPLIEALDESDGDAAARAIVGIGARLGLRVTAEGIETEAQAIRLREMGCDTIQGYYVGRPVSAARVAAYLRATTRSA